LSGGPAFALFSFAYATLLILLEHWLGFRWIRSAGGIIGFPEGTHRKGAPELTQASWTLMPSFLACTWGLSTFTWDQATCTETKVLVIETKLLSLET